MSTDYINLDRRFAEISANTSDLSAQLERIEKYGSLTTAKIWPEIVSLPRAVILAEAGAGKTEELKQQTKRLKAAGKDAFFMRLEHLVDEFVIAFEIGTNEEFQTWKASGQPGWFFLDSVDEARLTGPKQFERAIKRFGQTLGEALNRSHVFITSRGSVWRAPSDLDFVEQHIPYKAPDTLDESVDVADPDGEHIDEKTDALTTIQSAEKEAPKYHFRVFSLCPLSPAQIRQFLSEAGVNDPALFLRQVEQADAELFARHPDDLIDLIDYWDSTGEIGRRADLMENQIKRRLKERDPDRATTTPLTVERCQQGAEILAAACTLGKKSRIVLADKIAGADADGVSPKEVLPDWTPNEIEALLSRQVFDAPIYGSVRFHDRDLREYLTAKWAFRLLQSGGARRKIERLFFRRQYGIEVIVPSMRASLGWVVLWDEKLRTKTGRLAPEFFLECGDPSILPLDLRKDFLKQICEKTEANSGRLDSYGLDLNSLTRFSDPILAPTIIELLSKHRDNPDILALLLKMLEQSENTEFSENVVEVALDKSLSKYTRLRAMRTLSAIGNADEKSSVAKSVLVDKSETDDVIIGGTIDALATTALSMEEIFSLAMRSKPPRRASTGYTDAALDRYLSEECTLDEIVRFLRLTVDQVKIKSPKTTRGNINPSHAWLLGPAITGARRLIKDNHRGAAPAEVIELSYLLQSKHEVNNIYLDDKALAARIRNSKLLNDALFWYSVREARKRIYAKSKEPLTNWWQAQRYDRFWGFDTDDFDRVLGYIETQTTADDKKVAASLAFDLYVQDGRERKKREALKRKAAKNSKVAKFVDRLLNPPPLTKEARKSRKRSSDLERASRRRAETRERNEKEWKSWIEKNSAQLRDTTIAPKGQVWRSSIYLYREIEDDEGASKHTRSNWQSLIPKYGREVAEAFRDGCADYWRLYDPTLVSDSGDRSKIPWAVLIGLTGLEIEASQRKTWAKNLSSNEAERAAKFATRELNGFPSWLESLHKIFPHEVEGVLWKEIKWELDLSANEGMINHVLSEASESEYWANTKLAESILEHLESRIVGREEALRRALSLTLKSEGLDRERLEALAEKRARAKLDVKLKALWFATWFSVAPSRALVALSGTLEAMKSKNATNLCSLFAVALAGRSFRRVENSVENLATPAVLYELAHVLHTYIKVEEDIDRSGGGVYSPGLRDDAQDARNGLIRLLIEHRGPDAYLALQKLATDHPYVPARPRYLEYSIERAEKDSEHDPWTEINVVDFTKFSEITPHNPQELFELVLSRLEDLKSDLEEGDSSNAKVLRNSPEETLQRNFIGGWLRDRSNGRYSVPQEEELADAKRPDIRVHSSSSIDTPLPIELKVSDKCTVSVLLERLENQLIGDYLRDARSSFGIFLLTYGGRKGFWRHPTSRKALSFSGLLTLLENHAKQVISDRPDVEDVQVVGLDLTKRS
ncbi:MAG: hypothetical protein RLO08_14295 [Parvibaculaceae bacterium]